jgi:hypothetical protein
VTNPQTQGENVSRTLRLLAALALIALIVAGCANAPAETDTGSSPPATSPMATATPPRPNAPTATDTGSSVVSAAAGIITDSNGGNTSAANREQAVKFATCMRSHGVKQFPDPDASGQLTIDAIANGSSLDTNSAAFKQAISACKDLEPAGFTGAKRSSEQQQAALKFAQCIRDNGVKDFPDPDPNGPLVDTNRIPSTDGNGGMSILNAAMRKCGDFAASAGVTGGQ